MAIFRLVLVVKLGVLIEFPNPCLTCLKNQEIVYCFKIRKNF